MKSDLERYEEAWREFFTARDLATDPSLPSHVRQQWRKRHRALGQQIKRMKKSLCTELVEG